MWPFSVKKTGFQWEDKFNSLAQYNSECSHGIVHTEEYNRKMKCLQDEYDEKIKYQQGVIVIGC